MEGCDPRDMEEIENDAVRFAKKLGHSVENLKTLRAPNTINPFAKHRIDVSKVEFIEYQNPERGCKMVNSVFLVRIAFVTRIPIVLFSNSNYLAICVSFSVESAQYSGMPP